MDKLLLQGEDPKERQRILKDSCDKVVEFNYYKKFLPEEISEKKTDLSEVMIKLREIENELKEIKDEYKVKMKPLQTEVNQLLTDINYKARNVKEECYIRFEFTENMAGYYNADGELVHVRPLEVSEKQKTIMQVLREGTNG